jgi:hypothetical protein
MLLEYNKSMFKMRNWSNLIGATAVVVCGITRLAISAPACFSVESLNPELTKVANGIIKDSIENEAAFTLFGTKPVTFARFYVGDKNLRHYHMDPKPIKNVQPSQYKINCNNCLVKLEKALKMNDEIVYLFNEMVEVKRGGKSPNTEVSYAVVNKPAVLKAIASHKGKFKPFNINASTPYPKILEFIKSLPTEGLAPEAKNEKYHDVAAILRGIPDSGVAYFGCNLSQTEHANRTIYAPNSRNSYFSWDLIVDHIDSPQEKAYIRSLNKVKNFIYKNYIISTKNKNKAGLLYADNPVKVIRGIYSDKKGNCSLKNVAKKIEQFKNK